MKTTRIILIAAIATVSAGVHAQSDTLGYTYIEGGYASTDIDGGLDGDGLIIGASFAVTDTVFAFGDYTFQDFDFGIDLDQYEFGVGGHKPLAEGLDIVATASYLRAEIDVGPGSGDDDAIALGLGLRGRLTEALELEGGVKYADIDDFRDDLALNLGGRYYLTPQFALGAGVEAGDDVSTWTVGLRYEFR